MSSNILYVPDHGLHYINISSLHWSMRCSRSWNRTLHSTHLYFIALPRTLYASFAARFTCAPRKQRLPQRRLPFTIASEGVATRSFTSYFVRSSNDLYGVQTFLLQTIQQTSRYLSKRSFDPCLTNSQTLERVSNSTLEISKAPFSWMLFTWDVNVPRSLTLYASRNLRGTFQYNSGSRFF